jgi:hypothetical protein
MLAALILVLVQAAIGMAVNLYVTVPTHHPGAHPSSYFGGSVHSVGWAIGHGATALAIHATLGLVLAALTAGAAIWSLRFGRRAATAWSTLAALLVIGAGFNGASFLDFNHNANSLIMALLAFGAAISYAIALFTLVPRS